MINIKNICGKVCELEDINGETHNIASDAIITIPHDMVEADTLIEGIAKGYFIVFPNICSSKAIRKNREELEDRFNLMDFEPD